MKRYPRWIALLALGSLALGFSAFTVHSQQGGAPPGGMGGMQGGMGGMFDMNQIRQTMVDSMRDQVTATDEEWKVISPLLDKVLAVQLPVAMHTAMAGFGGMGAIARRMGGPGGPGGGFQLPDFMKPTPEEAALQSILDNQSSTADDIKPRLKAYRDSLKKSDDALKDAREKLRVVLSVRQEVQFILAGVLD